MAGIREHLPGTSRLDGLSGVEDVDVVHPFGDQPQIVRYEEDRHSGFAGDGADQRQDLLLRRDVERGGGLVANKDVRPRGECHCNHRALLLSA